MFFPDKMTSRFSGALQITNLDDFITPSQVFSLIFFYLNNNKLYKGFF